MTLRDCFTCGSVCCVLQVKVAVIVEKLANHRTEMVYKIVSPPFHEMPVLDGRSYVEASEDSDAGSDVDTDAKAAAAAAQDAAEDATKKKRKQGEASDAKAKKRPLKKQKE